MTVLGLGTAVLLRVFRFKNHINIPASGLQFVVVIFEIDVAFVCVETGGLMALFFYKEKNKDIRAAAYLRLSIEDGDKAESNSIGNQRELIRDFAAERPGLHLVEEYADDGYTGTNFERPGFKRMMEDSIDCCYR